jgi:anthranilate phosphoribosyltransferase
LKFRTAFNYLGPLTNPARAEMQVCGTWSDHAAEKIAGAMALLGLRRGYVVHGSDGLGEVTITGPSTVFTIENGAVDRIMVTPEDFGFAPRPLVEIRGNQPGYSGIDSGRRTRSAPRRGSYKCRHGADGGREGVKLQGRRATGCGID